MDNLTKPFFLIVCALVLICRYAAPALAAPSLVIGSVDAYPLNGAFIDVLKDPGRSLTIDDVASPGFTERFLPVHHNIPNFGMSDSAFWFRFTVDAGSRDAETWLLLLDHPLMNLVELYVPRGDGKFDVKRSGNYLPMSRRTLQEREILLPLPLDSAPRTFYLRTWIAGRAQAPLTVLTRGEFQRQESAQNFLLGACVGFMLIMMLLGVALFTLLRDRTYLLYACYALNILLVQFAMNGYLYARVLPEHPLFHEYLLLMLCNLAFLVGVLFARRFLRLAEYAPRLNRLFGWLVALYLLMVPLYHVIPVLTYKKLLNINLFVSVTMVLVAACISYRNGFLPARYFAYGRVFLSVSGVVYPLLNEGYLPVNVFTKNALLLASVGDVLFILLAIGHHFYVINRQVEGLVSDLKQEVDERVDAHRALKEQMEEKKRLELEVRRVSREERRRISHELHDGLCQQLTGARLHFAALEGRLSAAGLQTETQPLGALLQDSVDHAYALSRRLWNSDGAGSEGTVDLDELARRLSTQSNIPVHLKLEKGCPACSSAGILHTHLIAREAMVNAVKHSGATSISVSLRCAMDTGIRLEVQDNGSGISGSKGMGGGLGIGMMEYRAAQMGGQIEIGTTEGGGMRIVCTAPCFQ